MEENGNYYNRLYFVFPDGNFKKYDKRHTFTLAKEDLTYTAGKERLIVEYKGWKICPLVCYDLRFPVWARNTEDYDLLIYVANWPETRIHAWDVLLQARAIENMSYCIGVNRTGPDGNDYQYNGHTAVYDGLGASMFDNTSAEEFTKIVSLDRSKILEIRKKLKFLTRSRSIQHKRLIDIPIGANIYGFWEVNDLFWLCLFKIIPGIPFSIRISIINNSNEVFGGRKIIKP